MSDLTKWPRLLVKGEPVTEHQANDILIRTCQPTYLPGNDKQWNEIVNRIMGLPDDEWPPQEIAKDADARIAWHKERWEQRDKRTRELGIIPLEYLHTSRIASSWLGGPHGWCDWDGTVGCSDYNVGKWPSAEELTEEWALIAAAFPYLDLTAQAVTDEGEGEIAAEWRVLGGEAVLREPGRQVCLVREPVAFACLLPGGERGVSAERLEVAVAHVLEAAR